TCDRMTRLPPRSGRRNWAGARHLLAALFAALIVASTGTAATAGSTPQCDGLDATIVSDGSSVVGTPDNDVIVTTAGAGANIQGLAGDDVVCGGPGGDFIEAGDGEDRVFAGDGDDFIDGAGDFVPDAGGPPRGLDHFGGMIDGGPGMDYLAGGGGADE